MMEPSVGQRLLLASLFEAWQNNDGLRAVACFAPDAVYRGARGRTLSGREAIAEHFIRFFRDGPSWSFSVEHILLEGERGAVRYRFAFEGGNDVRHERDGCALITFAGGMIAEWREYEG
jgi:ketosteroid isomerase-like protein